VSAQLHLGLSAAPNFARSEFLVSAADREAVARVDALAEGALALVGPPGAGKTHLACAWARARGAVSLSAASPPETLGGLDAAGAVLVDDADGAGASDTLRFLLIDRAARPGRPLLLTARTPPAEWPTALPDLRSRLNALAVAELSEPDDEALGALLVRFFRERGVSPSPELVSFLLRRIERSARAAHAVVARLDDAAHAQGRPVGRTLAREVLEGAPDNGL
jgi:chromosomal replication initiation ATPase DnaA